jgi:predicted dehydrogenase
VEEKVRWGILGTGKIARVIATALAASRDGSLAAAGSRDGGRARAFAAEFGAARAKDYAGVVDDPVVDVVYIALPHPSHRMWAVASAESGKHVVCEKPIAVTAADAAEIVESARRHDVFLLEAFAYRAHPQTHRLVELLKMGAIGEIRMIDAVFGYDAGPSPENYLMDPQLGGGSILDVGCYTTSMAHLVAAAANNVPVVEALDVSGGAVIGPTGVDHSAGATIEFGGILARVACSIQANLESAVRIVGSEGRITLSSPWLPGRIGSKATIALERWDAEAEPIDFSNHRDVYTIEVDAVNDAIRKGERSTTMMSWDDSLANMRTLDRWGRSAGLPFTVDD